MVMWCEWWRRREWRDGRWLRLIGRWVEGERMNKYIYWCIFIIYLFLSYFLLFSRSAGSAWIWERGGIGGSGWMMRSWWLGSNWVVIWKEERGSEEGRKWGREEGGIEGRRMKIELEMCFGGVNFHLKVWMQKGVFLPQFWGWGVEFSPPNSLDVCVILYTTSGRRKRGNRHRQRFQGEGVL